MQPSRESINELSIDEPTRRHNKLVVKDDLDSDDNNSTDGIDGSDDENDDNNNYAKIKAKLNTVGEFKDHSDDEPSYEFMTGKMVHMVREVQLRVALMPTKENQKGLDDICKCFGGFLVSVVGPVDGARVANAMIEHIKNDE